MYLTAGDYITNNSDLMVTILKVRFRHPDYTKVRAILSNRYNGIEYETKNYKIYNNWTSHWKKINYFKK